MIAPHLLILPRSWTLSFPETPSSTNSNSPMYRFFWSTRITSLARFEAGMITASFFLRISAFCSEAKRFARMLVTVILPCLLVVFPEAQLLGYFSEALPAEDEVVGPDDRSVLSAAPAVARRLTVLSDLRVSFLHCRVTPN